jgi:hypothetical protein
MCLAWTSLVSLPDQSVAVISKVSVLSAFWASAFAMRPKSSVKYIASLMCAEVILLSLTATSTRTTFCPSMMYEARIPSRIPEVCSDFCSDFCSEATTEDVLPQDASIATVARANKLVTILFFMLFNISLF